MDPKDTSLPLAEIDRVWAKLQLVYGQRFIGQYDGLKLLAVKEDWRRRLAGLSGAQLDYALDNLPADRPPPDVLVFRRLAVAMPLERRGGLALSDGRPPRAVPERFRQALARLAEPPGEPAHIVQARAFIARWGRPEARPSETQQQWLAHWRAVLARWEARQAAQAEAAADMARLQAIEQQHGKESRP